PVQGHRRGQPEARPPARLRNVSAAPTPARNSRHEQARHDTMAKMLQAASLRALARVRHAFFTREGGVSDGVYASLNGGPGPRDAPPQGGGNRPGRGGAPRGRPGGLPTPP